MKEQLISTFNNAVNDYNNAMIEVEKLTDSVLTTILPIGSQLYIAGIKDTFDIIFPWYDESTDSTEMIIAIAINIIMFDDIKVVQVYDNEKNIYDFSELPTDTQIELTNRVIEINK